MEGGICTLPLGVKSLRVAPLSRRVPHGDGDDDVAARADPRAAAASETPLGGRRARGVRVGVARRGEAPPRRRRWGCRQRCRIGRPVARDDDGDGVVQPSRSPRALASRRLGAASARRAARLERGTTAPRRRLVPAVRPRQLAARRARRTTSRRPARRAADAQPPEPPHEHQAQAGTFGAAYAFGAQKSARDGPNGVLGSRFANEDDWPSLVRLCGRRAAGRRRRRRRRLRPPARRRT